MLLLSMGQGKSFKESLKALEADIQHANTLASEFPRDHDGACLQMRLSYSPAAHFLLFLVRWTDCSLAGALGLLRILIYKRAPYDDAQVYMDGTTTMSTHERKASLREFYAYIFPSLQQLQGGITEVEDVKQKALCVDRYKKKLDEERGHMSDLDLEREQECGICMETNNKIALPDCNHAMCIKCYREWHARSQSCPFCRDSLKRVNSRDLWIFTDSGDVQDMVTLARDNLQRLFMYIDKLPLLVSESVFAVYDAHINFALLHWANPVTCNCVRLGSCHGGFQLQRIIQWPSSWSLYTRWPKQLATHDDLSSATLTASFFHAVF